ncbi:Tripartite tricarboxylate transporter family receptor [Pigmentiphaga humi]|uniref:Tripartite tricarboxylate transporter family receptor n=1 Tax=Pigmentiphaga humi TaxID=2478468 RepID=A0A3P4B3S5_9BURK|nr:tripartite tricarboxylate transporter substrate binding protein [Pigmentiphaga humi]VCU70176.1 Tripartite tricarboxylate transporter family receptor [Pigmentiphaga humi]
MGSHAHPASRAAHLALAALLTGIALSMPASAESPDGYPSRPITIVVPYPAGGGADTIARLLAQNLSRHLNDRPIVVDNRTGAVGNIGSSYVARAPADGYTLLLNNNTITINAALDYTRGYDVTKDLQPVSLLASSPVAIGVTASVPAGNLAELVDYVRSNPDKANYASCGNGSPQHLVGAGFNQYAHTAVLHVPYNGCAPAVSAGLGNQVPIIFSTIPNLTPYASGNKLRMLAVSSAKRLSFMPQVPAMAETPLFKDMDLTVWFGLFAPAKTPEAIRRRIETAVAAVLADPGFKRELNDRYYEVDARGAEAFRQQIGQDLTVYSQLGKRANIRLE